MKTYAVTIHEKFLTEQGLRLSATPTLPVSAQPGQYYLAFAPGTTQVLPVPLFPFSEQANGLELCGKVQLFWQTGTRLLLQGPMGRGFAKCLKANHLALFAVEREHEERLYCLAVHALRRGADVTWITDHPTIDLPPQVEILKTAELHETITWSDACAIAAPHDLASMFIRARPLSPADRDKVEIMIDLPTICGNSQCGVCALETRHGWKYACKDGPVFLLEDLQDA